MTSVCKRCVWRWTSRRKYGTQTPPLGSLRGPRGVDTDGLPLGLPGPGGVFLGPRDGGGWRHVDSKRSGGLALGRGSTSAAPAPGLVADGAVRHSPEPELGQRANVVALQTHQRNQHFVALPVEDGRGAATARLGVSTARSGRLASTRKHGRGDFVEHRGPADEQANLTRPPRGAPPQRAQPAASPCSTWVRPAGGATSGSPRRLRSAAKASLRLTGRRSPKSRRSEGSASMKCWSPSPPRAR